MTDQPSSNPKSAIRAAIVCLLTDKLDIVADALQAVLDSKDHDAIAKLAEYFPE